MCEIQKLGDAQSAGQKTYIQIDQKREREEEEESREREMGESNQIQKQLDLNDKWDACLDLGIRRFVGSTLAGGFGGLLLFRSPATRWASLAFGAGVGIGSAYTECSYKFFENSAKSATSSTSESSDSAASLE